MKDFRSSIPRYCVVLALLAAIDPASAATLGILQTAPNYNLANGGQIQQVYFGIQTYDLRSDRYVTDWMNLTSSTRYVSTTFPSGQPHGSYQFSLGPNGLTQIALPNVIGMNENNLYCNVDDEDLALCFTSISFDNPFTSKSSAVVLFVDYSDGTTRHRDSILLSDWHAPLRVVNFNPNRVTSWVPVAIPCRGLVCPVTLGPAANSPHMLYY